MYTSTTYPGDATTHALAVDKLAKHVAGKETAKHLKKMKRNEVEVSLPTKSFCNQFFESFPSYYKWSVIYATTERYVYVYSIYIYVYS